MEDYRENLEKASNDLNLVAYEQDWGIANADYERIIEFIQYFECKENELNEHFICELAELIIASFNDFLAEEHKDVESTLRFSAFINYLLSNQKCLKTISYWESISQNNCEEFPVREWLQLQKASNR